MRKRYRKTENGWVCDHIQEGWEVDEVFKFNDRVRAEAEAARMTRKSGGVGSKDMRFLGRVPENLNAQWHQEWQAKGGLKGTGMKAKDYCVLKLSNGEHLRCVLTPSGRTGFERQARRRTYRA